MQFPERTVTLKNGQSCLLRSPGAADAQALLEHMKLCSAETPYLLCYPDERTMTVAQEEDYLREMHANPAGMHISAFVDGELAGNVGFGPLSTAEKQRHRTEFGIAVKQKYWGLGIGGALLEALEEGARLCGYSQLELEVAAANTAAAALYEKHGFAPYGRRPRSSRYRDGSLDDALLMVKML